MGKCLLTFQNYQFHIAHYLILFGVVTHYQNFAFLDRG